MGGGLMQLVAQGAQDIYLYVTKIAFFLKLFTEDIPILLLKQLNKPLQVL